MIYLVKALNDRQEKALTLHFILLHLTRKKRIKEGITLVCIFPYVCGLVCFSTSRDKLSEIAPKDT